MATRLVVGETDLATLRPDLANQWHPTRNGHHKPTNFTTGASSIKVWWRCEAEHDYQATIRHRARMGSGCPYCSGRLAVTGSNDLATDWPELTAEWDTESNDRSASDVTPGSSYKAWWRCSKRHSYQARVADRTGKGRGTRCPYCAGRRVIRGETDLATLHPEIAVEWHPTLNGDYIPSQYTAGSLFKAWWQCANGHDYQTPIAKRTGRNGGCPYCAGRYAIAGLTDLATLEPAIAREWDFERNDREPSAVKPGSEYKAWWICPDRGHSYITRVDHRTKALCGCPYCGGRLPIVGETDLAALRPELATEWHPTRNTLTPRDILVSSNKKVWWVCADGHEWRAQVASRTSAGTGCPVCTNRRIDLGINDLATLRPDLADEWHPTRNSLSPQSISIGSGRTVWWKCQQYGHEWEDIVSDRAGGYGCPFCSGKRAQAGFNDLSTMYPELAAEWHTTRNSQSPNDTRPGSSYQAWWICSAGHDYQSVVSARVRGRGCAYCAGKKVLAGFNDVATARADLAEEWHPTKNTLNPTQVSAGSKKAIWWICPAYGHDYRASVADRAVGNGCPACAGKQVVQGFNDLATLRPDLAAEWHPTKNTLDPAQVTSGSSRVVSWRCKAKGHEWDTTIASRAAGRGCFKCSRSGTSKREEAVCSRIAMMIGIEYTGPQRLPCWPAPIDLLLVHARTAVEYDGWYWHQGKADVDRRKTEALQSAGWNVVRIRETTSNRPHLPHVPGTIISCTDSEDPSSVAHRTVTVINALVQV
ncbi:zinc-ribbon domain-containing protein [Rhodococcus koreensis]